MLGYSTTDIMSDLKTAQDMMAAAMAAKPTVDPELGSVTQLLKSLDRASKNVRTFGHQNSVAKKFFDQFYTELLNHVERYNALTFIVQREGASSRTRPCTTRRPENRAKTSPSSSTATASGN